MEMETVSIDLSKYFTEEQIKEWQEEEKDLWCECKNQNNIYYVENKYDKNRNLIQKHGYKCCKCHKYVQIG